MWETGSSHHNIRPMVSLENFDNTASLFGLLHRIKWARIRVNDIMLAFLFLYIVPTVFYRRLVVDCIPMDI